MGVEGLEDRKLLSTIKWVNEFTDTTFAQVYGANAPAARAVVNAAIDEWERVITNFNYQAPVPTAGGAFELTFNAVVDLSSDDADTPLAHVLGDSIRKNAQGKPFAATVELDDDAANLGWYFDSVFAEGLGRQVDHGEYDKNVSRFAAGTTTGPAAIDADLYTVVLHEIGHAVGFFNKSSIGSDGSHFDESAHPRDLMNPTTGVGERKLVSDADALFLQNNYGYTVSLPSNRETMLAVMNRSTGQLLIRGELNPFDNQPDFNNNISVGVINFEDFFASFYTVQVNGAQSSFPVGVVNSVKIDAIFGNNTIGINNLSAFNPLSILTGNGNDSIAINVSNVFNQSPVTLSTFGGNDSLSLSDKGSADDVTYTVDGISGFKRFDGFSTKTIGFSGINNLSVSGGLGDNIYDINQIGSNLDAKFFGNTGSDTFRLAASTGKLDGITGPVFINGGGGFDRLEMNDANNTANGVYSVNDTLLTKGATRVQQSAIESVNIFGGKGSNTFNVEKTTAGFPVTLSGNIGDDTFQLSPTAGRLSDIAQQVLLIGGGGGFDRVSVNDTADAAPASYSLSNSFLSRNGTTHFSQIGLDEIVLFGNNRGNNFAVESVDSSSNVKLFGGSANDNFRLAQESKNLNSIGRAVTFIGGNGFDTVTVNDAANTVGATFRVDGKSLNRNGKGIADLNAGIDALSLLAGSGADTLDIERTDAEIQVTLSGGNGTDTFRLAPTSKNLNSIAGALSLSGAGAVDTIVVNDQANTAGAAYLLSSTKLTRTVGTKVINVNLSGVDTMTLLGGVNNDSLAFNGSPAMTSITYNPGAGNDSLGGVANANTFNVTSTNAGTLSRPGFPNLVNFTGTENLAGNAFDDTFKFANGTRVTGRIDGLGGSDTLDYSAYTTSVLVNMISALATGTGSGGSIVIGTIENVIGGSAADNFVGDGADNIFLGNGGDDIISARDGNDIVVGGDGKDTILDNSLPATGVTERNILIGGRGADTISGNSFKEELIIGGSTIHDNNITALRALMAEWKSGGSLASRVAHIRGTSAGGLNGAFVLKAAAPNATVFDDAIADIIRAGSGIDWFFVAPNDDTDRGPDDLLN